MDCDLPEIPLAPSQKALIPSAEDFAALSSKRRGQVLSATQRLIELLADDVRKEQDIIDRKFEMARWAAERASTALEEAAHTRALLAGCMASYIDLCQVVAREAADVLETSLASAPAQVGRHPEGGDALAAPGAEGE